MEGFPSAEFARKLCAEARVSVSRCFDLSSSLARSNTFCEDRFELLTRVSVIPLQPLIRGDGDEACHKLFEINQSVAAGLVEIVSGQRS